MGALSGVRVLDLSRVFSGPWASQMLADFGADVIKVERPGRGDDVRQQGIRVRDDQGQVTTETSSFIAMNRGKRSITVDMSQPEGQALIRELAAHTMRHDFRSIDPARCKVILIEGQTRVLGGFHEKLSRKALEALQKMGIEVTLDCHVTDIQPDHVIVKPDGGKAPPYRIDTTTVVWAAGVKANPLGKLLANAIGVETDRAGRVPVNSDCTVGSRPDLFVIGDLALFTGTDGKPLPGLAPVAMQQGEYVADAIKRKVKGESPRGPFKYWDKGTMATIGRAKAVAESMGFRFSGYLAWLAWLFIHIMYLAQFQNRVLVLFQWFWNYITRNRSARLITGERAERG